MSEYKHITHTFNPVYDEKSRILILGSLPSVKSREEGFYYGHPRNRFWKLLGLLYDSDPLTMKEDKVRFLLEHNIALYDVIESCDIIGSSDSSIKNVKPSDIQTILKKTQIKYIYANGTTAGKLYEKYIKPSTGISIHILPSTSPANASYSLEKLILAWKRVLNY